MPIAHIYNGELGFDVRTKLNALIDQVAAIPIGGGTGDVTGPAGAIADAVAVYNGTTGKLIKDGGQTIADIIALAVSSSGSGDVVGPASAVNNQIAIFNGTTGKLIADGGMTIADVIAAGGGGGGMAIGGAITGVTAGSVLFAGVGGVLAQHNSHFYWDDTNYRLKIGTAGTFGSYYLNNVPALYEVPHVSGSNWFEGNAGNTGVTGFGNFGTGDGVLTNLTSGSGNVGLGGIGTRGGSVPTLYYTTSGSDNLAMGSSALMNNTVGNGNVAVGNSAMWAGVENYNTTAIGGNAFLLLGQGGYPPGFANVGIGYGTATGMTNGDNNIVIGTGTAPNMTVGNSNTIVGGDAFQAIYGTCEFNTWVGSFRANSVFIPGLSDSIVISGGRDNPRPGLDRGFTTDLSSAGWAWSFNTGFGNRPVTIHVYNTLDASPAPVNYERAVLGWTNTSNVFTIGTEAGGAGVVRPIRWAGLSNKATPVDADHLLLLDSVSSDTMKTVLLSALGGTTVLSGSGVPSTALGESGDYYVDETGNQMYGPKGTVSGYGPDQIAIPPSTTAAHGGSGNYELANHVEAAAAGQIVAVRYYRDPATAQVARTVNVWTTGGALLSSGSVANDGGGSGWKQITLTTPVVMAVNDVVVVSVGNTADFVQGSPSYPITNGGDVSIINGAYGVGAGGFPSNLIGNNYFTDVVFQAAVVVGSWPMAVDGDAGGGGGGSTILSGSGVPADALGSVGDYYLDEDGNQLYGPKAAPGAFGPDQSAIPPSETATGSGSGNYEIANHVKAAAAGQITAVRYWRPASTAQIARTVNVWTTGGTLLATASVANDGGGSGWKQITLTTPVAMAVNDVVVVSYGTVSDFVQTNPATYPISNGGDISIIAGSYAAGSGNFPLTGIAINYFSDVVFQAELPLWPIAIDGDALAIGDTVGSGTSGSVLFVDASNNLAQDATFFWDNALDDLHIGGAYYATSIRALYVVPHVTENNWFEGNAGNQTMSGYGNFGTGDLALSNVTTGFDNVGVGTNALRELTSGYQNMGFGSQALRRTQTDTNNVAVGYNTLATLGWLGAGGGGNTNNIAVGFGAMNNVEIATANVALGTGTLANVYSPTTANNNTVIGGSAGGNLGVGGGASVYSNTMVGSNAGQNLTGASSGNTFIGSWGGPSASIGDTIALSSGLGTSLLDFGITKAWTWSLSYKGYNLPTGLHIYNSQNALGSAINYERGVFDWVDVANVFRIGVEAGGTGTLRLMALGGFPKAGAPAAADVPANYFAVIDDTSAGQTWLVFNKAGAIRKVQLT